MDYQPKLNTFLAAFVLASTLTCCVHAKSQWEICGELPIEKQGQDSPNNWKPQAVLTRSGPYTHLHVNERHEVFIGGSSSSHPRVLRNGIWESTDWPREEYHHYMEDRTECEDSIVSYLRDNESSIGQSLFNNIVSTSTVRAVMAGMDRAPDFEKEEYAQFGHEGKSWDTLSYDEKTSCATSLIQAYCQRYMEDATFTCVSMNRMQYILISCYPDDGMWSNLGTPRSVITSLAMESVYPTNFYDHSFDGRDIRLYHTLLLNPRIGLALSPSFNGPSLLFGYRNEAYLVLDGRLYRLTESGTELISDCPILIEGLRDVPPAYFQRDKWLYVFGQSSENTNKAVVLKLDLDSLSTTSPEKGDL
jgi:hypothetical protein